VFAVLWRVASDKMHLARRETFFRARLKQRCILVEY